MKRPFFVVVMMSWALFCVLALSLVQGSLSLTPSPTGNWIITHVINPEDPASYQILNYLTDRKAAYQYDELIIFTQPVTAELEVKFKNLGFLVKYKRELELHLEESNLRLPFFLLTSPRGEGAFAGLYGNPINDLAIARSFFSSQALSSFPIAGCGVSVRIQKRIDPQGTVMSLVENTRPQ